MKKKHGEKEEAEEGVWLVWINEWDRQIDKDITFAKCANKRTAIKRGRERERVETEEMGGKNSVKLNHNW